MEKNKKISSPQSIIVLCIVLLIFTYIGNDALLVKPHLQTQIDSIRVEYRDLSLYLDKRIPEIETDLESQASVINQTKADMDSLKVVLDSFNKD